MLLAYAIAFGKNGGPLFAQVGRMTDVAKGQQTFATNCAGCHGLDGKGGERGPDIVMRANIRQFSDNELLQIVTNGVPRKPMPAFGYLGEPAVRAIVSYLRTLQGNASATALAGDPKRGRELFFGKSQCSSCHAFRGKGGFFASDLSDYSRGRSAEVVREAIVSPNKNLDPRNRALVVKLSNGKTFEGIARNEDNFSVQLLTPDGAIHLFTKSDLSNLSYRKESPMPADYGTRLSQTELDDIVSFLFSSAAKHDAKPANSEEEDEE